MSMTKYEVFLKAVEYGNFTRVAEAMNFTQSGISHIIASLEGELGTRLLVRSRGGVTLTSDGREMLPFIKELSESEQRLKAKAAELSGLDSGSVKVAAFASVSIQWIPYIVKKFKELYPNVDFELISAAHNSEIESWVMEGKVDCSFIRLPSTLQVDSWFLQRDQWKVILPQGHPLADKEYITAESLAKEPFILLEEGDDYEIAAIFDKLGIRPNVQYTIREDQTILSMVSNGLGISIMPELMLKDSHYPLAKRSLPSVFYRDIGICVKDREAMSVSTRRFVELTRSWVIDN